MHKSNLRNQTEQVDFFRQVSFRSDLKFYLTVPRPDWLLAGHPDVPRGDHQEPGPGAEQAEGEDQPAGGGEGGTAQPEPGGQRTAQTASDQAGAGTEPTLPPM